ncbi:MAG: hypothetical protein H6P99_772 [Holophagaceae bacterium]|nr:hypothetical protein [Holophagaceae bacterium]
MTDLLDMEGATSTSSSPAAAPLPDEGEDTDFFIEAPVLPEPPEAGDGDISFLTDLDDLPSAASETIELPPLPEPAAPVLPAPAPMAQAAADEPAAVAHVAAPAAHEPEPAAGPSRPAKSAVKADPLAVLASLKLESKRPAAKPKAVDAKDAIHSLMGELTQVGRSGAPSVLRLEVPAELDGQEIEVVVQLRRQGQVLAEGQIQRPAPGKGSTAKLSVELKRS